MDQSSAPHTEAVPQEPRESMEFDVVIVGAGAAGLFCAGVAGQLGLSVLLVDHIQVKHNY